MGATVDDVEGRHRQHQLLVARQVSQVLVQGNTLLCCTGLHHSHTSAQQQLMEVTSLVDQQLAFRRKCRFGIKTRGYPHLRWPHSERRGSSIKLQLSRTGMGIKWVAAGPRSRLHSAGILLAVQVSMSICWVRHENVFAFFSWKVCTPWQRPGRLPGWHWRPAWPCCQCHPAPSSCCQWLSAPLGSDPASTIENEHGMQGSSGFSTFLGNVLNMSLCYALACLCHPAQGSRPLLKKPRHIILMR